ncbi:EAL domain-containing protein [Bacillus timonensis]|nr:EAL domain-containing protein [Bacillus timonensis]
MYILITSLSGFFLSYFVLKMAQKDFVGPKQFISTSMIIASSLLVGNYGGFAFLFTDILHFKPVLSIMTVLITLGISFSLLRFFILVNEDDTNNTVPSIWKYIGSLIGGISLVGIPYIVMYSSLNIDFFSSRQEYLYLIPYIIVFGANILIVLVPDLLGDEKRKTNKSKLIENQEQFTSLFNHNPDAVFSFDLEGNIIHANKVVEELTGYSYNELLFKHFSSLVKEEDVEKILSFYHKVLIDQTENEIDVKLIRKNGSVAEVRVTSVPIVLEENTIGSFGIVKDITESTRAQEKINYLAYYDELTGLPNRRLFMKTLVDMVEENRSFSIVNLDFDRFKRLNDLFGHAYGDKVLMEIANRLKATLPRDYQIARMGGDEFNIIIPRGRVQSISDVASKLVEQFREPLKVRGQDCLLTASIGIANYPEHSRDIDSIVKFAEIAMYHVKEKGSNGYQIYDDGMNDKTIDKINLENELRSAIHNGELTLYYQPKMDVSVDKLIGTEALVRWNHPIKGMISPGEFIPLAEETGLIVSLERWVLRDVCRKIKQWEELNYDFGRVAVNISFLHFYQEDLVDTLKSIMKESGIQPSRLELEITESTMMNNEAETNKTLQQIRDLGIVISMDDFGTGYSSLGYLHKLSIDRLKIDRSFIMDIHTNEAIVTTIIAMAKHLQLKVLAEGVETIEQLSILKRLGCTEIQGFYFSRPLPNEEFEMKFLAKPIIHA